MLTNVVLDAEAKELGVTRPFKFEEFMDAELLLHKRTKRGIFTTITTKGKSFKAAVWRSFSRGKARIAKLVLCTLHPYLYLYLFSPSITETSATEHPSDTENPEIFSIVGPIIIGLLLIAIAMYCLVQKRRAKAATAHDAGEAPASQTNMSTTETEISLLDV